MKDTEQTEHEQEVERRKNGLEARVGAELFASTDLGVRSVLRELDVTDLNSNVFEVPVPTSGVQPAEPVAEGNKIPREGMDYERVTIRFDKFGFEVTDDVDDDAIASQVDLLHATIASEATKTIYSETGKSFASVDNRLDVFSEARITADSVVNYGDQDTIVVSALFGEAIADSDPTREWDELRTDIQDDIGVRIVTDPYNIIGAGDVLVANSERYGYEAVRQENQVNSYVEYEEHSPVRDIYIEEDDREIQSVVTQAHTRRGFGIVDSSSARIVRFGRV